MTPPHSPPASTGRNEALRTLARHFSPEIREACERFFQTRVPADADTVVLAIMLDHLPDKARRPATPPADTLALVADLGFDSVAIAEMVFFLEDLFEVRISNEEILRVRTVGDLRAFVRQKLDAQPPAASPA
jgi:acyl carrier protein